MKNPSDLIYDGMDGQVEYYLSDENLATDAFFQAIYDTHFDAEIVAVAMATAASRSFHPSLNMDVSQLSKNMVHPKLMELIFFPFKVMFFGYRGIPVFLDQLACAML